MHLQPDYSGIMDLVGHYAEKMALASSAVSQNLWATKISTVFFAGTDAEQQSIKKAYDRMSDGDPMVVVSKNLLTKDGDLKYEIFNRDVKQSYVIDLLLSDLRKIEAEFDTRIASRFTYACTHVHRHRWRRIRSFSLYRRTCPCPSFNLRMALMVASFMMKAAFRR
jgi:hypothetical protein